MVDDEAQVRLVFNRLLSAAGYEVLECANGLEAIARLDEKPALVVLDVEMPCMDGWKTLGELRHRGHNVPVLMLTHLDQVADRVKGLESGADDYLGKPCDLGELLARVKALLRRTGKIAATLPRLRFGEVIVDLERKLAVHGHQPLKLTGKEYALLELFARHRGKPVSREDILSGVWQMKDTANSHTLETHLWRLRRKLGDIDRQPRWIRNLPGIGYVMDCDVEEPPRSS